MKPGDLVMDICNYADITGAEDMQGRIGIIIEIINFEDECDGKFDPPRDGIVEVLMENGIIEDYEIDELEVISESR